MIISRVVPFSLDQHELSRMIFAVTLHEKVELTTCNIHVVHQRAASIYKPVIGIGR